MAYRSHLGEALLEKGEHLGIGTQLAEQQSREGRDCAAGTYPSGFTVL